MTLVFVESSWLWLLLLVPLFWFLPRRATNRWHAAIRSAVAILLILALARPAIPTDLDDSYQVLIWDRSESVDATTTAAAESWAKSLPDSSRMRVVTLGGDEKTVPQIFGRRNGSARGIIVGSRPEYRCSLDSGRSQRCRYRHQRWHGDRSSLGRCRSPAGRAGNPCPHRRGRKRRKRHLSFRHLFPIAAPDGTNEHRHGGCRGHCGGSGRDADGRGRNPRPEHSVRRHRQLHGRAGIRTLPSGFVRCLRQRGGAFGNGFQSGQQSVRFHPRRAGADPGALPFRASGRKPGKDERPRGARRGIFRALPSHGRFAWQRIPAVSPPTTSW